MKILMKGKSSMQERLMEKLLKVMIIEEIGKMKKKWLGCTDIIWCGFVERKEAPSSNC